MYLIYTPTVGQACEKFSQIYRRKRGFISYPERHINRWYAAKNATKQKCAIVVTDGERILGIRDQGIEDGYSHR
jgi:malate dehydrogenase (oxaloacetate-decarboxylating)